MQAPSTTPVFKADFLPDVTSFRCPICCDLLFRPVINPCGHWSCFLCMHHAMNPYDKKSTCIICRRPFKHLASVCDKLNDNIRTMFPEEAARRAEEGEAEYAEVKSALPDAKSVEVTAADFSCANPSCGKLLVKPAALNCGCLLCLPCSRDKDSFAPVATCPNCSARNVTAPNVCLELEDFIHAAFPEEWLQRKEEIASWEKQFELVQRCHDSDASPSAAPSPASDSVTETAPPTADLNNQEHSAAAQPSQHDTAGTNDANSSAFDPNFIHYCVGCDDCGLYPIIGRRYQCQDCPDGMGYDLCGECYDAIKDVNKPRKGRFNQHHLPTHKDANPGVPLSTLISWIHDAMQHESEESPEQSDPPSTGTLSDDQEDGSTDNRGQDEPTLTPAPQPPPPPTS